MLFRRARLTRGLTQRQVAEQVRALVEADTGRESPFDAGYVSRIERGLITWPHKHYRQALCTVLGAENSAELGLTAKQLHHEEASTSNRRDVLATALTALLPPTPPLTRLRMGDIRAITERTGLLEHWDRASGGRAVRDFALRELHAAVSLTEASTSPAVRRALLGAIARLANLTAWASFDAGLFDEARSLFQVGLTAGREHGDTGLLCHLATNAVRQEIHLRHPGQALKLAGEVGGRLPAAVRAMLCAVLAQIHALNGDERQVARHLVAADHAYDRVTDLASGPAWTSTITAAKIGSDTGFALYLLSATTGRDNPQVVADLRRAAEASTVQAQTRVRAMATARLATVLYRQGERIEADHHAAQATALATTVGSARLTSALTDMRHASRTQAVR
ncbi:multiprotein-bridging factor 1 family protein [Kitasatospora sp. NPDC058063]|uniref:helix-turn-helix domain-containing protein n=1 Tax=unclassified Kitasatospora TaxID=2633591 RepID=UPI0036D93F35